MENSVAMFELRLPSTCLPCGMGPGGDAGGDVAGTGLARRGGYPSAVSAGGATLTAFRVGLMRALGLLRALGICWIAGPDGGGRDRIPAGCRQLFDPAGGGSPTGSTKGVASLWPRATGFRLQGIDVDVARYRIGTTVEVCCHVAGRTPTRNRCPRASAAASLVVLTRVAGVRRHVFCRRGHYLTSAVSRGAITTARPLSPSVAVRQCLSCPLASRSPPAAVIAIGARIRPVARSI